MKVFISWSGDTSRAAADALRSWLPNVLQFVKPWMSKADIEAGARWGTELHQQLSDTQFGVLCVTQPNQENPWLLFEAGALSKVVDVARVCPYLIGLSIPQLKPGPLTQFQAKLATREDTLSLVKAIHGIAAGPLSEPQLDATFAKWWPDLEKELTALPRDATAIMSSRTVPEMVAETLELVRSFSRQENRDGIPGLATSPVTGGLFGDATATFERNFIVRAFEKNLWSTTETAKYLGIPRPLLRDKIYKLGLRELVMKMRSAEDDTLNVEAIEGLRLSDH